MGEVKAVFFTDPSRHIVNPLPGRDVAAREGFRGEDLTA